MTTKLTMSNLDTSLSSILPTVTTVSVCDAGGTVSTDLALRPTGGYLKISGSGFITGCILYVNGSPATATTVISPTEVRVQMPALAVGTYSVMLFNTATVAAIWVAGVVYSAAPVWSTTAYNGSGNVVNTQLVATGDVPLVYSLQAGSSLPTGVTLSSTGLLSGTATAITSTTTVTFTVAVSDLQLQSTPQLISLSMTFYVGKLYSWGSSFYGGLGLGDTISRSSPVQVGSLTDWASLSSGGNGGATSILGAKTDGTLWSWGRNAYGTLGLGDTINRSSPVQVGTLTDWSVSSSSQSINTTVVVKTNGSLWTWGGAAPGGNGTLGLGDTIRRSSPTQVGLMTTWLSAAAGLQHTVAIKTDGTMWTWGWGPRGSLGQNNTLSYNSPVQVGALTNWLLARTGQYTVVAIKTNGTLWSWGKNENGQLGLGDSTVYRSSPIQVGSLTNWKTISVDSSGQTHVLAIKTDGTLWTWGNNSYGTLGDGTTLNRSSPVQIGSLTTWESISASDSESYAIKTDGTLWTWGRNYSGALGLGDTFRRSSPVQVGLLNTWIKLSIDGVSAAISS